MKFSSTVMLEGETKTCTAKELTMKIHDPDINVNGFYQRGKATEKFAVI